MRTLAAAGMALALCQFASAQQPAPKPDIDEYPDKFELNGFLGGSFFQKVDPGLGTKLVNGGAAGFRATENFWKYIGIEQAFTYSTNNVRFLTPVVPGGPQLDFGHRIYQYSLNPVFYFAPRGSRFRPFLTAGGSLLNFSPIDSAKGWAGDPRNASLGASGLDNIVKVGLNYGGGVKYHLTERLGLRFDVRGLMSGNPTFSLLDNPGMAAGMLYIPRGEKLHGVQTTAGITYYIGQKAELPPPPPPPPPAALEPLNGGSLSTGTGTLCQGRPITVRANGVSDPAGRNITYKWKVNGQPMGGSTPELTFTPDNAGAYNVELEVEAPNTGAHPVRTAKANSLSLSVQPYAAPTIAGVSADPSAITYGQTSNLTARATGSACSTVSFLWTATEGAITNPTSANAIFDSKTVRFEQGGKIQSKTVTVTGKVTDDRGASATGNATVKVDYIPASIRYSDVIFGKLSARVNNCGKRVLLEEVAPKAADPDYEIVLVGHIDQDEASKTRRPSKLDEQRVANAYAVLTGGSGTCASVDKSRIKVTWVGTEQTSDFQPGLCGTSARTATKERSGSLVSTADQNRRVEVWLVPKGTKMPAAFKEAKQLDPRQLKRLACPR